MRRARRPAEANGEAKALAGRPRRTGGPGRLREVERQLAEARAREAEGLAERTATSEVLGIITRSPGDLQAVLDAVAERAARLCGAADALIVRTDGDTIRRVAHFGDIESFMTPRPLAPDTAAGRAILERRPVPVDDMGAAVARGEFPGSRSLHERTGVRTVLAVPLVRADAAIGAIVIRRLEVRPFDDQHIARLETFADQAAIAIENARLLAELHARNRALAEALARQAATSEILHAISSSRSDLGPVFRTILSSANALCDTSFSILWLWDGEAMTAVAHENVSPALADALRSARPRPQRGTPLGLSALERTVVHVSDLLADARFVPDEVPTYRLEGARSILSVPMVSGGRLVGALNAWRREPRAFSDSQIDLLKTFADQAVIAIEDVRLFTELQARNRELARTLDQQTATSEILRVISGAHTDAQPVFETIVQSAARLCDAANAALFLVEDGMLLHPANYGGSPEVRAVLRGRYPRPVGPDTAPGLAVLERAPVQFADIEDPSVTSFLREAGRLLGFRSCVAVPMMSEGQALGAIVVTRTMPGRFSDAEVELLRTFTDQAVIAIANVRLFRALETRTGALTRSVEQLTALGEVGRAVSSSLDLETVLTTIVSRAVQLSGLDGGVVFEYDERAEELVHRAATETGGPLAAERRATRIRKGEGVVGRTAVAREPVQVPDITVAGSFESRLRPNLIASGIRAVLAVPMVRDDRLIGCLVVTRNQPGGFPAEAVELLRTLATQSALAILNARLFREIEDKSRQLEAASQHKSEFLANMSHELRTPLNAIIGFSEALTERMFGDLNPKQEEYLRDIHASGQHLLSLINDILDLSKVEAGRMELELSDFDVPAALEGALSLVRERAARRGIALHLAVDPQLGPVRADERKIRQIVLNLLSNAIKFTPEGGRIDVGAGAGDGRVEVWVRDSGIGIAPEDQEAIFEEFRQVGTAAKKVEGTGLGLTLCRKFAELHGGAIRVESRVGEGSTFTVTLPLRAPSG